MKICLVVWALVASLDLNLATDDTMTEQAKGTNVVETVCSKIDSVCIFPDDKMMLRRMAFVETSDGYDSNTYAPGYYGGIWKVDYDQFLATKQLSPAIYSSIQSQFNIAWSQVTWNDLLKPFYSGLAARLVLYSKISDIPRSVTDQANLWVQVYRNGSQASIYVNKVTSLYSGCKKGIADIVFVIDGSGSITINNFMIVKNFLKNITGSLNIGPDPVANTRIAVVQFSNTVKLEFDLDDYSTYADYASAIDKIVYLDRGTQTDQALDYLTTESFLPSAGARPSGVPKIGIVITDGASNDYQLTLAAATRLHQKDITVFAIGIGSYLNNVELNAIATDPDCKNVFYLDGFFDLDALKEAIEKKTCEAPVYVSDNPLNITLHANETKNCKVTVTSRGLTVEISGENSTIYFSNNTYPTSSFYDLKLDISENLPAVIYFPGSSAGDRYMFCHIVTLITETNTIEIETVQNETDRCKPNPCPFSKICVHRQHFLYDCVNDPLFETTTMATTTTTMVTTTTEAETTTTLTTTTTPTTTTTKVAETTTASATGPYDCQFNNPCTPANAAQNKFYFPYHDPKKFVQCSEWGQCYIMPCSSGLVWNQQLYTCFWNKKK